MKKFTIAMFTASLFLLGCGGSETDRAASIADAACECENAECMKGVMEDRKALQKELRETYKTEDAVPEDMRASLKESNSRYVKCWNALSSKFPQEFMQLR